MSTLSIGNSLDVQQASDFLSIGIAHGSPVSLDYYGKMPFA
jgi:hypothetical protein